MIISRKSGVADAGPEFPQAEPTVLQSHRDKPLTCSFFEAIGFAGTH
jgi:hypothetical protein